MPDDVLSNFLIKITYDQDERSRKKFDESLKQVQTKAADFGDKMAALPLIVSDATKRISSSLSELYYSAQKNGATARELDQLRYAAEQSGEGADAASASFNAFSQRIRDFATGAARQYKALFGVDIDPNHTMDAFLKVRDKIEELRNRGGAENLSRANLYARTFGIDEDALISGRMAIFKKAWLEQAKRNEGIAAEKAVALTRAYNALAAALETVARKADAALFDKFGAVLDRLTRWLDEDSDRIVKFFTDLVTQIGLVFTDLSKLSPAFAFLWDALKEVGGWLQKIIGQPDGSGLAGVRHLLEFISGVVMARFVASMVWGFVAAFAPLTALLAALAALGIISVGAYTVGEAIQGWLGGGSSGGGFGPGEGTASGGHGATRRGRFGHGGGAGAGAGTGAAGGGGGKAPEGSLRERGLRLMNDLITKYGYTPESAAMAAGQAEAESNINPSGPAGDAGASVGMFQDQGSRRVDLRAFQARHPEMSAWESNVAFYAQERQQLAWQHEHSMARAGQMGHATEGYGDSTEGKRTRMSNAWFRLYNEQKRMPTSVIPHIAPDFHKRLDEIRSAKPSTPWQQSSNEIHDHRAVTNDVNIHVAGGFPVEKTERPLSRPRNADLIRNTASYAA